MSVWYRPCAAINPEGTQAITDATIQLYAVDDTTFAEPLTVEDAAHVPTQTLRVTNYLTPGFWGPDEGVVVAKSGDWVTLIEATEGLRDAAEAAATAAQTLASSAIQGIVEGDNINVDTSDPTHPKISFNLDAVVLETNFSRDPSFEYTVNLPTNPNGTVEYNTSIKHSGTRSVKMTNTTGTGPFNPAFQSAVSPETMGMENGDQVTWSVWVYVPSATTWDPQLRIGGAAVGTAVQGSGYNVPKDTWTRISVTATIADATSTNLTCYVYGPTTSGEVIYVDDRGLARGTTPVNFSGDDDQSGQDFYRWRGTAGQSFSERYTPGLTVVGGDGSQIEVTDADAYWTFEIDGTSYSVAKPGEGVDLDDVDGISEFVKSVLSEAEDAEGFREAIGAGTLDDISVSSDDITDATSVGKAVMTASNQAAARTAIGAGTSSLTTASSAETLALSITNKAVTPGGLKALADAKLNVDSEDQLTFLGFLTENPPTENLEKGMFWFLLGED
jgi:hypothetical protein